MAITLHDLHPNEAATQPKKRARPRPGLRHGQDRRAGGKGQKARPATCAVRASKAVRCRCSAACPSAASRTPSASRSFPINVGDARTASTPVRPSTWTALRAGAGPASTRVREDPRRGRADQAADRQGAPRSEPAPRRRSRRRAARPRSSATATLNGQGSSWRSIANIGKSRSCGGGSCSRCACWRSTGSASSSRSRASTASR